MSAVSKLLARTAQAGEVVRPRIASQGFYLALRSGAGRARTDDRRIMRPPSICEYFSTIRKIALIHTD
jgi:hypothetical protein